MLTFNKQAFLRQFNTPAFWHAIVSEHFEVLDAALQAEDADEAQAQLAELDAFIGAPPLFSHVDYLLQLVTFSEQTTPAMQAVIKAHIQAMKRDTHAFAAEALGESLERNLKVTSYFIANLCALAVETKHLGETTRLVLLDVLPLSHLRNHPVYTQCIESLRNDGEHRLADFLAEQPHQAVALRPTAESPTRESKPSRLMAALSSVNASRLLKAFIFMRQLMPVAAERDDDEETPAFKAWLEGIQQEANVRVIDTQLRPDLPATLAYYIAESKMFDQPLRIYSISDQHQPQDIAAWNFNDLTSLDNQQRIQSIFDHHFIPFIQGKQKTDGLNDSTRMILRALIGEVKTALQQNPDYLNAVSFPSPMLSQMCLIDAWVAHNKEFLTKEADPNKLIYLVGPDKLAEGLTSLDFIRNIEQITTSNMLYAFHLNRDQEYGVKVVEAYYYEYMLQTSRYGGVYDLLAFLYSHQSEYQNSDDPIKKFTEINHCVALAQAILEGDLAEEYREKLETKKADYISAFTKLKESLSHRSETIDIARISRVGYTKAAKRYIEDYQAGYMQKALGWLFSGFQLIPAISAVGLTLNLALGGKKTQSPARRAAQPARPTRTLQAAPPAPVKTAPVPAPKSTDEAPTPTATAAPAYVAYQESEVKQDHHRIEAICQGFLAHMDDEAKALYTPLRKVIAHDFYLDGFLRLEHDQQEAKFKSLIDFYKREANQSKRIARASMESEDDSLNLFSAIDTIKKSPECNYNSEENLRCLIFIANHLTMSPKHETPLNKALAVIKEKQFKTPDETVETAFDVIHALNNAADIIKAYCGTSKTTLKAG